MLSPSPSPTPEIPHTLVGSYYLVDENIEAKLLLNNKGNAPLEVQPTLYNKQGQELQLPSVTVEPQNFRFINLADWAAIGGESYKSGNIKLFHYGKDLVLGAQIYLTDEIRSLSYEEKLTELTKFDSRRMEAVWWMPSNNAKVKIILTNTTDAPLDVTGRLAKKPNTVSDPQTVQLAAHQTKVFDLRDDFPNSEQFINAEILALSLEHSGAKDALLGRVLLAEPQRGYSNVVQFSNPNGGKSNEYQGVGFQIEDIANQALTPVIVARNVGTTTATIITKVPYTRANGTRGTINLPPKQLSAGEMGLINTQNIITRVQQENIKVASLEVTYNTPNGSVIVAAHSVSEDHNQVFRVPMWDPFGQRSPTGGYPWRIEGTSVTQTYIKNIADYEEEYVAFLVWENGGMYMFGLKPIAAHETVQIDVKRLRDEQIPDEQGRTIPLHISSGQLQWTLRRKDNLPDDDALANLALIGRSEQVDITKGYSNNYSCQNCCPGTHQSGFIIPNSQEIEVGETAHYIGVEVEETCYGFPYQFNISASWSSSNSGMGTISGGSITPQTAGQSTIGASWTAHFAIVYPCGPEPQFWELPDQTAENCNDYKFRRGGPNATENENSLINSSMMSPPCGSCVFYGFTVIPPSANLKVKPIVGSLKAEISQSNDTTELASFTTFNKSLAFATNSNDLFVGFKGGYDIQVTAENVVPPTIAGSLKWLIKRDPADPSTSDMDTGVPSFNSTPTGTSATINADKAGNFQLINWYDANENNEFDTGEELRVLKFALAKAKIDNNFLCEMLTDVNFELVGGLGNVVSVETSILSGLCTINLKSGGANKDVGLDKVRIGPVSNLFSFYQLGNNNGRNREVFYDSPPNTMITPKTTDVTPSQQSQVSYPTLVFRDSGDPIDGDGIFRSGYETTTTNGATGGTNFAVSFNNKALELTFPIIHPGVDTQWASTVGIPEYGDFLVGYVDGLNKTYVVFAKMPWEVNFAGIRDAKNGEWKPNGAYISLNGDFRYPGNPLVKDYDSIIREDGSVRVVGDMGTDLYGYYPYLNTADESSRQNFDYRSWEIIPTPKRFTIDVLTLPDAQVNVSYSVSNRICGSEGVPPYSWTIIGSPVPGLTLSSMGTPCATLSGIPTNDGNYVVSVRGTDAAGISYEDFYSLRVLP